MSNHRPEFHSTVNWSNCIGYKSCVAVEKRKQYITFIASNLSIGCYIAYNMFALYGVNNTLHAYLTRNQFLYCFVVH